ncbi:MAG: hypothetical protein ACR2MY_07785 [Candidatus Dormibacteria bacterium]
MSHKPNGATLDELCADHPKEGEVLRQQLRVGEHVDMYVVGNGTEILALTRRSLYIIKPGFLHLSGRMAVEYPYDEVTQVVVHASHGHLAFEVCTDDTLVPDPSGADYDIDYDLPNVVPLEEHELPAFEGALALVLERVANARP